MISGNINPSDLVKKFYLPNKLEVLLISSSDKLSLVSFGLDLGSIFDPKDYLGFSKVLSCVSQYFQTEGKQFTKVMDSIQKKGQACITYYWIPQSSETTIEFSGIFSSECLDEYLRRIRSSLDLLDYSEEIVTKCLGMLKKEYENEVNSSAVQKNAVLKSIFNSELRGSLMTVKSCVISDLVKEIKKFKKKFYSSNIMKLVIESSLTFEHLTTLVNRHFSTIPNLNTDIKLMRYNIGLKNLHTQGLLGNFVEYKGVDNKISFVFVLDSEKGAILGSNRIPLFEYLVKHYFCGEYSGSLRNAISPLILTCNVEYYAERLALVWFEVESDIEQIPLEETLELLYSSVVLLRKTKIKKEYFEFLINNCVANYMNFNWFDFKLNIQDRISSLINYNVWHKLERYCKYNDLELEEFNKILNFLDIENILILVNSNQANYLMSNNYEDYVENITEIVENQVFNTSFYSFSSNSGNDECSSKSSRNKIIDCNGKYVYHYEEPLLKIKYNIKKISPRLINRLKQTKESFGIINGLSRPFINPYTPKDFKLVDFIWECTSNSSNLGNDVVIDTELNTFIESYNEFYPNYYLLTKIGDIFKTKMVRDRRLAICKYHDTQISISENVNVWYKARNDKKHPYFKGILRLSSAFNSFKFITMILSYILVISMNNTLNLPLIQDAKLTFSPRNSPEQLSNVPSLDLHISGYSSSLYIIIKTILSSLNSEEVITETVLNDSLFIYKGLLMKKKETMTSELKARELSWRIIAPNYPTLGRQYLGLSQITYQELYNEFKKFKENLCIDGLFIGNLDRAELEKLLKEFSTRVGIKAKKEQCLKLFKSRSFPIKDFRGTANKVFYHYNRPDYFELSKNYINSNLDEKAMKKLDTKFSIENLFKLLNEECGQINCTNEVMRSGYLDFKLSSDEFGPNIALLDIIIYKNIQDFYTDNVDIGILYLNDAYYNTYWLNESLKMTSESLSLKTFIEAFDSYYKWSVQLESWDYSANDLGLYISKFTDKYSNYLKNGFGEDYKAIKNLTISKLKNKLLKSDIDEEFNSHKFNLGYSESVIESLKELDFFDFKSKMNHILNDYASFLLVQVQSTEKKDLILACKSQNLYSESRNPRRIRFNKNMNVSIPPGYKHIKHIDELIQDDRIPLSVLDTEE
ncbi:hypothetical protein ChUKH1_02715 [Cryptosporidium hominis]|uniref:Insulinase like peptidase n=1 Tax=Cryptosporidium hominis TaxID=237895 RepID=A0ABX5B8F9_CRYHO|nr:hypothetical protein ChTU502y2012_422g0045 [Cryptosporidium hominis]PPA64983.1 hypothetical protein ChUKH1_02715 [Cryptosporidium hominis]PPS92618.1 Insulinase like peptidase [Cryptosporidium hominis]|eukprot:PPS92618.1 Insulinase like peptidase [Cryptosporidium hominis]